MQSKKSEQKQLRSEIQNLRQELAAVSQENSDLKLLLKTITDHADCIEAQLHRSNEQLKVEIKERSRAQKALQFLLAMFVRDTIDLQILLDTTTEHGDLIEELMHDRSIRDPLTELFNRRYLEQSFPCVLEQAKTQEKPLSLMMMDIDRFKRFNDTFGHQAGDAVLQTVGQFLRDRLRSSDIACRYGGEELMAILPATPIEAASRLAERLRQEVKGLTVEFPNRALDAISMSFGVAAFPQHGTTGGELIRAADAALYRAKVEGRDRVVCAERSENSEFRVQNEG